MFKITVYHFAELAKTSQEVAAQDLEDTGRDVNVADDLLDVYFYANGKIAAYEHECEGSIESVLPVEPKPTFEDTIDVVLTALGKHKPNVGNDNRIRMSTALIYKHAYENSSDLMHIAALEKCELTAFSEAFSKRVGTMFTLPNLCIVKHLTDSNTFILEYFN